MNTKTRDELIADLIAAVDAALKDCDEYYELAEALGIERDDEVDDRVAVIGEKSVLVLRNRRRALAELDAATLNTSWNLNAEFGSLGGAAIQEGR